MYTKFLKAWIDTKNKGFLFSEIFIKNNWRNISIYGAGTIGEVLCNEIRNDINVVNFIDNNKNGFFCNDIPIIHSNEIIKYDNIDVIIITPYFQYAEIVPELMESTDIDIISIKKIIGIAMPDDNFVQMSEYLSEKGVEFFLFDRPKSYMIKNPSSLEMAYKGSTGIRRGSDRQYAHLKQLHSEIDYFSKDYFNQTVCNPAFTKNDPKSEAKVADTKSEYFNVINGHRFIPDQPDRYLNTIYLLGDCSIPGAYAEDRLTFANQLQMKINNLKQGFRVVAYASIIRDLDFLFEKIMSLPLVKGDIVIYEDLFEHNTTHHHSFFEELSNIHRHSLTSYFNRPHEMGEIFIDSNHLNYKGYKLMADGVFDIVFNEMKILNRDKKTDRPPIPKNDYHQKHVTSNNDITSGIEEYLNFLKSEKINTNGKIGSIVVNCNPFTLGHKYIIESAAGEVDFLYVFVVEEDKSMFPFKDRMKLVEMGVSHLDNVKVIPSGKFIISTVTFPNYFNKEEMPHVTIDASKDVETFAKFIAPLLDISIRFAGSEPYCPVTKQYNRDMREILPRFGVEFKEFSRVEYLSKPISASRCRQLISENNLDEIKKIVPKSTYDYLVENFYIKQ